MSKQPKECRCTDSDLEVRGECGNCPTLTTCERTIVIRNECRRREQREQAIRQDATEKVLKRLLPLVETAKATQLSLFRECWDKNTIELVKQVGMDLREIEESLWKTGGE